MKFTSYMYAFVLSLAGTAALAGDYAYMQELYMRPDLKAPAVEDILEFGDQTLALGTCYARDDAFTVVGLAAQDAGDGLRFDVIDRTSLANPGDDLQTKTFADLKSTLEPLLANKSLVPAKVQDGGLVMLKTNGKAISIKKMGVFFMVAIGDPAKITTSAEKYCFIYKNMREARQMRSLTSKRFFEMAKTIFDDKSVTPVDLSRVTKQPGVNVTHGICASGTSTSPIPAIGALLTQKDSMGGITAADFAFYTGRSLDDHREYMDVMSSDDKYSKDRMMVNFSRMFGDFFATASAVQKGDQFTSSNSVKNNMMFRYRQYGTYIVSSMVPLKDSADLNPDKGTACVFFLEPNVAKRDPIYVDPQKNWFEHDKDFFSDRFFNVLLKEGDTIRIKAKPVDDPERHAGALVFETKLPGMTQSGLAITELASGTIPWSTDDNKAGFKILKMTTDLYSWEDDFETPGVCFKDKKPQKGLSPIKVDVANENTRLSFKMFSVMNWALGFCTSRTLPSLEQFLQVFDVEFSQGDRLMASQAFSGW